MFSTIICMEIALSLANAHCICVSGPCEILSDVNTEELKAVYGLCFVRLITYQR